MATRRNIQEEDEDEEKEEREEESEYLEHAHDDELFCNILFILFVLPSFFLFSFCFIFCTFDGKRQSMSRIFYSRVEQTIDRNKRESKGLLTDMNAHGDIPHGRSKCVIRAIVSL